MANSVVVVGAGHIGISCAHYLHEAGFDVTVIDQGDIGGACSHANCGFLVPGHVLPLATPGNLARGLLSLVTPRAAFRIKPQARPDLLRWFFEFGRRCSQRQMLESATVLHALLECSLDEYGKLLTDAALACEWQQRGLLFVFRSERALGHFADEDAWLTREFGVTASYIPGSALPEFEPALLGNLAGAYYYDDHSHVRPDRLNEAWSNALAGRGVRFTEDCRLTGIERQGNRVTTLLTSQGSMSADSFVFATGAWSGNWAGELGCRIPVEPGKGYSVTMSKPAVMPVHPMLMPEKHIGITPFASAYRIASMMEFAGFDDRIPEFRVRQLQDSARPYLRDPVGPAVEQTWYGWRPMTWDSLPIIGRVPRLDNTVIATGHNMLGLTLAPVTGRIVADILAETTSDLPLDAISPARFE